MKKIFLSLALLLFFYGGYKGYKYYSHKLELQRAKGFIGQKVPNASAYTLDGKRVSLDEYKGKRLILIFWASWCKDCLQEIPHISKFYENLHKQNIALISISIDKDKTELLKFLKEKKINYPILFDKGLNFTKKFQLIGVPSMWIIDKKGVIKAQNLRNIEMVKNFLENTP